MSEQQEREATTPHCPCCTGHKEVTMNFRKTVGEYWYKCHGCGCEWYEPSRMAGIRKRYFVSPGPQGTGPALDDVALYKAMNQPPPQPPACAAAEELQARYEIAMKVVDPHSFWQRHGSITRDAIATIRELSARLNERDDLLKVHESQQIARDQTIQRLREAAQDVLQRYDEGHFHAPVVGDWFAIEVLRKAALTDTTPTDKGEK